MDNIEVITIDTHLGVSFQVAIGVHDRDGVTLDVRSGDFKLPESVNVLLAGVPRGATVLDLGANIGTFALAAAAFGYNVVAVEASTHNVELLRESVRLNRFTNVRVVFAAISDRVGTIFFQENGAYGMVHESSTAPPGFVSVPTTTVDELLAADYPGQAVGFVKMDIEGSEVVAVGGMKKLLGGDAPPPIFYESNGHTLNHFHQTPAALISEFRKCGYKSYHADPKRLAPLSEGHVQFPCVVDYLATKGELTGAWRDHRTGEVSVEEQIQLALSEGQHPMWTHRAHAVRSLSQASQGILTDPRIRAVLATLKADTTPELRGAMDWYIVAITAARPVTPPAPARRSLLARAVAGVRGGR